MIQKDELRKRVAIYLRVSSQEQKKEGLSLEAQKNSLMKYCEYKGYWVYKHYVDAGKSGGTIKKRPAFKEMLEDMKKEKFSGIIVTRFDRAFRNVREALNTLEEFKERKIDFVSVSEDIDTTTPLGKVMFVLISVFAELERDKTKDRNDDIKRDKFYKSFYPQPRIPFGYKKKNGGNIVIDIKKSEVVRKIFENRLIGMSIQNISANTGMGWQVVDNILKNKVYCGYISFEGQEKKGIHEPIISEELWRKVNEKT